MNEPNVQQSEEGNNSNKLYQLLKEVEQKFYPGCKKFTKLSFIVHLYHLKCLNGWTDKSFTMLLELLSDALPEENTLPKSFYDTKKIISGLGLSYGKIHACPNDCILYRIIGRIWIMLKIAQNVSYQDGNTTLMMLNVEKRYQQRFFVGFLLCQESKDFFYHKK
uniref:Uncharacterized protein n=1 Tax=Cajanus cajan TaxID=3821 RepID=A0A151R555_CAJCA|nr:hypothetical protein KK1_041086 [Cajanus cajan]